MSEPARFWGVGARWRLLPYAHQAERPMNWTDRTIKRLDGALRAALAPRRLTRNRRIAAIITCSDLLANDPSALAATLVKLPPRLLREGLAGSALDEALAAVRAAFGREIGFVQRPVQIYGAMRLIEGCMLEMATGEGKSATAILAAGVMALAGVPVHVVTVNEYLARRDAESFASVFARLGLRSALVHHELEPRERARAYAADVVFVDNKELVFDYLRDRIALGRRRTRARVSLRRLQHDKAGARAPLLRGLHFAIIDEADSILVDEAGTPLVISAPSGQREPNTLFRAALDLADTLIEGRDFVYDGNRSTVRLRRVGRARLAACKDDRIGGIWAVARAREELLRHALVASRIMMRGRNYIIQDDKVVIVDEFTGRAMPDRTWRAGLHQMVEVKEGLDASDRLETAASITYQRFFRQYLRLSGMTGTGMEVAGEMRSFFALRTVPVPTHRPVRRHNMGTQMAPDWGTKLEWIAMAVGREHAAGRPVLVGVRSVAAARDVSGALEAVGLRHVVLSAEQDADEADRVHRAGAMGSILVATNMAGRGTDIPLGPGVEDIGGLHVILTEFHESSRIDRQLYGRAARQGQCGTFENIVAWDDELFTRYAPGLRYWLGLLPGSRCAPLAAAILRLFAQRQAEAVSASTRRAQVQGERDRLRIVAAAGHDPL